MTIKLILSKNANEYIENPRLLKDKEDCKSLSGKFYLLTGIERNRDDLDAFLRERSCQSIDSFLEEYDIGNDSPFGMTFVSPTRFGLNKSLGFYFLTKSALRKKGITPRGLYKIDNQTWEVSQLKNYLSYSF